MISWASLFQLIHISSLDQVRGLPFAIIERIFLTSFNSQDLPFGGTKASGYGRFGKIILILYGIQLLNNPI